MRLCHMPEPMVEMDVKGQGTIFFEQPFLGRLGTTLPAWTRILDPAAKFAVIDDPEKVFALIQHARDLAQSW